MREPVIIFWALFCLSIRRCKQTMFICQGVGLGEHGRRQRNNLFIEWLTLDTKNVENRYRLAVSLILSDKCRGFGWGELRKEWCSRSVVVVVEEGSLVSQGKQPDLGESRKPPQMASTHPWPRTCDTSFGRGVQLWRSCGSKYPAYLRTGVRIWYHGGLLENPNPVSS